MRSRGHRAYHLHRGLARLEDWGLNNKTACPDGSKSGTGQRLHAHLWGLQPELSICLPVLILWRFWTGEW